MTWRLLPVGFRSQTVGHDESHRRPVARRSRTRLDEAALVGVDDDLDAVAELELAEDPSDVALDGRLRENQQVGGFTVNVRSSTANFWP
jgi:hypothetical protein